MLRGQHSKGDHPVAAVGFGVCSLSAVSQEGILGFGVLKVWGGEGKVVGEGWDLGI